MDILTIRHIRENLHEKATQKLINSYIAGDRLAILTQKGELILIGEFTEHKGIFYSNDGYKTNLYKNNVYYYADDFDLFDKCEFCGDSQAELIDVEDEKEIITLCKHCLKEFESYETERRCDYCFQFKPKDGFIVDSQGDSVCEECQKQFLYLNES